MTAPAEPARDIRAWLTEAERCEHIKLETLRRQKADQLRDHAPEWQTWSTAREIDRADTVEHWLAKQLRELPGGER
jgi:hypothetical protein